MTYSDIADNHYVGERFKVFTKWEGDKRWQEVKIISKFPYYALVSNGIYSFSIHWQTFLETERVVKIGG